MVEVLRARETLQVCKLHKSCAHPPFRKKMILPYSGAALQYPSSSAHTQRDHHGQSSQLVELCKRFGLSNDSIDKEISDDHILEIYPQLEKWRLVAAHLGLTKTDVQAIVSQASLEGEELMRLYMLQEWKAKKTLDGAATYQVLLEALIKCGCSKSATHVCQLLS